MSDIHVTKSFMPPIDEYVAYLNKIWQSDKITNQGPLLREFEDKFTHKYAVNNFHYVNNGTIAIQLALKDILLGADVSNVGEVITTPFSYAATTSAILAEGLKPVYADIDRDTLNLDPGKIEGLITDRTVAILPVHVYGNVCDVEKIEAIAKQHSIPVIYDAAHCTGVKFHDESIFNIGDYSTVSFHATKLLHTVEGGGVFCRSNDSSSRIELIKRFGHHGDSHNYPGINAKNSEFHAAMGLCNLSYIDDIIEKRKNITDIYDSTIDYTKIGKYKYNRNQLRNYSYYPVVFESEESLMRCLTALNHDNIYPRRYFYPSITEFDYVEASEACPVAEDLSKRVLCLPLYVGLEQSDIERISKLINSHA